MAEIAEIEDTLIEKSVFIDRTRIYFDRVSSGSKFGPISACLLAYSQSAIVDFKWLLAWGAMTVFFDVAISIVAMRFRALDTPPSNPSPWLWVSFVLGGCVGASWGASFWIFASEAHFEYYLYNLAFLAGVSMASIGAITPFRAGAVAYMTGILGIPLLRVLIVPPPQAFVVAASLVLLALIQWRYAQQSMNELLGNLRSTARNVHLAKLLAGANAQELMRAKPRRASCLRKRTRNCPKRWIV
jgi:hypothetical protein